MKAIKTLAIVLLLATSASAGKSSTQYEVCAIDPGGKLGVYEVTTKRAEAVMLAKYLERKSGGKRHYFVVVEAIDAKGDVK